MTRLSLVIGAAAFFFSMPLMAQTNNHPYMPDSARLKTVKEILREVPLIDGHNDLAWQFREYCNGDLGGIDLARDNSGHLPTIVTDIPRCAPGTWGANSGRFTFRPCRSSPTRSWPCWNKSIWFIA